MPQAAAQGTSMPAHPLPPVLEPGPGCLKVWIGGTPAWRALPSSMASAVEGLSNTMNSFMKRPQMTPADAVASIADISVKLVQGGAAAAAAGAPAAAATAASQIVTLNAANVALTATWTAASVVPGGQPATNIAYTEGIKAAAAAAATAVMASMAGLSDMHTCATPVPIPPHGPGFVTVGSATVLIGNLSAARQGDKIFEACGGQDPIARGCLTVMIGSAYLPGLMAMADAVNPAGSVINCGNIVDAVIARLYGTDPNAVSPAGQDGSFAAIGARHGTAITFGHTMRDAFNAVQAGGPGTTALIGISYAGGGSHIVTMTNVGGHVGIVEGQNWGAGNPREVITDVSSAEARYGANSDIGIGVLPNRAGAPP
jgi:uncharacterized Zn-binding protein involved in type VI secretion